MQTVKKSVIIIFFTISLILFSGNMIHLHAAWSPPVQISAGPSSTNPSGTPLVINSNSVALVGWLDGPIGVAQTLSSSNLLPQSVTWSSPQVIYTNTIPGSFPSFPTLSQDIYGGSVAAFGVIDPMTGVIILNATRRPPGTEAWPAPFTLTLNGNPVAASLAVDDLGDVAALFALTTTGTPPYDITLVQLPANSNSWSAPITLAQDNSSQPALAAKTYKGQGSFAWKVNTPTLQLQTIRFNFLTGQASPIINVPLPPLTTDIVGMDISVDSRGDAILIYAAQIGSTVILYSSTLLAGQNTWSNPLLISDPANNAIGGSIASDAIGNTTILWGEEVMPNQQFVRVATLPLGGVPTFVTDLTDRNLLNTTVDSTSRVVMDSFGNAAAIWGITTGGVPIVQVSSQTVGQNWIAPETLSFSGFSPLITLSDQGTSVTTWIDSVTNVLIGSRNLFLFPLTSPAGFVGKVTKNEFLTEIAYFLKMHWDQSPAPNITNYQIFKNGKLLATTQGDGPFKFLQPLHSKHVNGTYTLVATASNGNISIPIQIVIKKK